MPKNSGIIQSYPQLSSAPSTPGSGYSIIYPKSDGKWYTKNPDGNEYEISKITPSLGVYAALGGTIKAEVMGLTVANISITGALTSQLFKIFAVHLPVAATLTGVRWWHVIQGVYTANNYNGVGLYTYSGGTLTLVASSTDDGNIWKAAANTWSSKAFSNTYAAAAGLFFVGNLYCSSAQTTAPTIGAGSAITNAALSPVDFTNSARFIAQAASLTALPSSQAMSGLSAASGVLYFGIY